MAQAARRRMPWSNLLGSLLTPSHQVTPRCCEAAEREESEVAKKPFGLTDRSMKRSEEAEPPGVEKKLKTDDAVSGLPSVDSTLEFGGVTHITANDAPGKSTATPVRLYDARPAAQRFTLDEHSFELVRTKELHPTYTASEPDFDIYDPQSCARHGDTHPRRAARDMGTRTPAELRATWGHAPLRSCARSSRPSAGRP